MIFYYDVLLVDDESMLNQPHARRRCLLERLVTPIKGRADVVAGREIQFRSPKGPKELQEALAEAFVKHWEGLILKPLHDPYFKASGPQKTHFASCWIKLKKDYIPGLGDTADFAIVGAAYNASEASKYRNIKNIKLSWTRFHIGCLTNKKSVLKLGAKPHFAVIGCLNACKREDVKTLNNLGQFQAMPYLPTAPVEAFDLDDRFGVCPMSVTFREPFVFEVLGSGFERQANQKFYTLRFPRVLKIHWDRTWKDTVDFDELQAMAEKEIEFSSQDAPSEFAAWTQRLEQAERGKRVAPLPWDDSDEEYDIEETANMKNSACSLSTPKSATPFLIRMDTKEMGQRILNSNQSSPKELKSTSQKRGSSSDEYGIKNGVTKKAKLHSPAAMFANDVSSNTSANTPGYLSPAARIEPLQPLINCTARVPDFSLVRKNSTAAASAHDSKRKTKMLADSCSPGRESTASEASITEVSQLTPKSQTLMSRPRPSATFSASATHFDLPRNPENPKKVARVEIPSLTDSSFILNPSIANMSYLREFFSSISPTAILLPFPFSLPSSFKPHDTLVSPRNNVTSPPQHRRDTVLLMESFAYIPTSESMKDLILSIFRSSSPSSPSTSTPAPTPAPVAVWDWRVLEDLKSRTEGNVQTGDVRPHFFARIDWVDRGEILITWGDGRVTRVGLDFVGLELVKDM